MACGALSRAAQAVARVALSSRQIARSHPRSAQRRMHTTSRANETGQDILASMARHPLGNRVLKVFGLPRPPTIVRDTSPIAKPLRDMQYVVIADPESASRLCAVDAIVSAGGTTCGPTTNVVSLSMGTRQPARGVPCDGAVIDITDIATVDALPLLYRRTKDALARVSRSGRIVFIARDPSEIAVLTSESAATAAACAGFVRSLAKELGSMGTTANVLHVAVGAEQNLPEPLVHLLSHRAAFVTGQAITVNNALGVAEEGAAATSNGPSLHERMHLLLWHERLTNRRIVVTGAARGIGFAAAQRLGEEGARLLLVDHPSQEAAVAAAASRMQGRAEHVTVDLASPASGDNLAAAIAQWSGEGVDGVVHNAGITADRMFSRMDEQTFQRVIDVNLGAVIRIDASLLSRGLLRRGARVVLVSSISGIAGAVGQTNYSASKSGVIGYARQQAARCAATGAAYNCVAPGFIETQMTAAMPWVARELARRANALSQGGLPTDVAEAIVLLSSPRMRMTGQVLRVCGGHMVGQ